MTNVDELFEQLVDLGHLDNKTTTNIGTPFFNPPIKEK